MDTHVYVRPTPHAWRTLFIQPPAPNGPPLPLPPLLLPSATVPRAEPEPTKALEETLVRERSPARRTMMPWVLFLAAFGIAFGIGRDRELRTELASELRVATATALAALETSATRLGRQVAELR